MFKIKESFDTKKKHIFLCVTIITNEITSQNIDLFIK